MTDEGKPFNLNEWIFDEYIRYKEQLAELAQRHDDILNRLTEVCRRNDELRAAGVELVGLVAEFSNRLQPDGADNKALIVECRQAIDRWREANA